MSDNLPSQSSSPEADTSLVELTTSRFSQLLMMRLLNGSIGAVRIANLVPIGQIGSFLETFNDSILEQYDPERYDPPSAHFGPLINDWPGNSLGQTYWDSRDGAEEFWRTRPPGTDLRAVCVDAISASLGANILPATVGGRQLFWGMMRETRQGTLIHWDEAAKERFSSALDELPQAQLAFNLFLSVPTDGGEAMIWKRRWQPSDERHRCGYGYSLDLLRTEASLHVKPHVGDAVVFDSRNYHAVRPSARGGRLSLSFFIGVVDDNSYRVWS